MRNPQPKYRLPSGGSQPAPLALSSSLSLLPFASRNEAASPVSGDCLNLCGRWLQFVYKN